VVDARPGRDISAKKNDYAFDERAGCLYLKADLGWVSLGPADAPMHDTAPPPVVSSALPPEAFEGLDEEETVEAVEEEAPKPKGRLRRMLGKDKDA
jgi:hypothetical protein